MKGTTDFLRALDEIEREKGVSKKIIFDSLEKTLLKSYEKNFGEYENVKILDRKRRLELPVWKVSVENEDRSCYYITPSNGRLREYNTRRRTHFWMYSALHALRFKFLTEHPV